MSPVGRAARGAKPQPGEGGLSPVAAGAILIVLLVVVTYLGFTKAIPFRKHFEINAVFRSSNNLQTGSPVRIAGVEVGRVVGVKPTGPGARSALVRMRLAEHGRPLHTDATAEIRPRIFLEGNFFVDVHPGTPTAPILKERGTIPVSNTSTPVQLDQVLGVLRRDTREDLRRTLIELGRAYRAGLGRAINRSWQFQPDAYQYTSIVNQALLGQRPRDLGDFIRDQGVVAAAIDSSPQQLKSLLTDFNTTAGALAAEEQDLRAALVELPVTLRTAKPTLDALNRAFPPLRQLAREALPGVRTSGPTIDVLMPLIVQLRGLVSPFELQGLSADLRGTIPALAELATDSVRLLEEVRAAASCQNEVILPWSKDHIADPNFPAKGRVYEEAVKWLPGIAGESRSFDANAPWFKVLGSGGVETFQLGENPPLFGQALFPFLGSNPPKPVGRPPLKAEVPCENQEQPDLRTNPGGPPKKLKLPLSARSRADYAAARQVAIDTLQAQLLRRSAELKARDRDATAADTKAGGE
jgi:virulence factor Mce-like protein